MSAFGQCVTSTEQPILGRNLVLSSDCGKCPKIGRKRKFLNGEPQRLLRMQGIASTVLAPLVDKPPYRLPPHESTLGKAADLSSASKLE